MKAVKFRLVNAVVALMMVVSIFTLLPEGTFKADAADYPAFKATLSSDGTVLTLSGTIWNGSADDYKDDENIKKILVKDAVFPESAQTTFSRFSAESIEFKNVDWSRATYVSRMF